MMKKRILTLLLAASLALPMMAIMPTSNAQTVAAKAYKYKSTTGVKFTLPKGYTRAALLKAYQGKPSKTFIKASMKGVKENTFSSNKKYAKKKDNKTKVRPDKLTSKQRTELAKFSLDMINQARAKLGLKPWKYSKGTEKLASDIAKEYTKHKRGIAQQSHYTAGIVRASKKNGLNLNDNYVEDMAGFKSNQYKMTMTQLKKSIYFGIKQMVFGYTASSDKYAKKQAYYREWGHAGDLFNTQGSSHDGDWNYYGFSVSRVGKVYSLHYISVPRFVVKSKQYNLSFKP